MKPKLKRTLFGNPVLRQKTKQLAPIDIKSQSTAELIADMRELLSVKRFGVGLAATQVGKPLALSVIYIRPTKLRPNLPKEKWADLVIINPVIVKRYGQRQQMHEGCVSLPGVFATVPRYKKVRLKYYDQNAKLQEQDFNGLLAHVIQHEVDHLNGILFVDRVTDTKSYMSAAEYRKRVVNLKGNNVKKKTTN